MFMRYCALCLLLVGSIVLGQAKPSSTEEPKAKAAAKQAPSTSQGHSSGQTYSGTQAHTTIPRATTPARQATSGHSNTSPTFGVPAQPDPPVTGGANIYRNLHGIIVEQSGGDNGHGNWNPSPPTPLVTSSSTPAAPSGPVPAPAAPSIAVPPAHHAASA